MTTVRNTFESGLTTGTPITPANSGTPDAFTNVVLGAGGSLAFTSDFAMHGTRALVVTGPASTSNYVEWGNLTPSSNITGWAVRFYFYLPSGQSLGTTDIPIASIRSAGGGTGIANIFVRCNFANALAMSTDAGSTAATGQTTGTISYNTWYRMEWVGTNPTANTGTMSLKTYLGDSTTEISALGKDLTGVTIGTSAVGTLRLGRSAALGNAATYYFDDAAFASNQSSYFGVAGANVAPTADAGANKTVISGATATVTGTDSDTDGSIVSRAWTFSSLPAGVTAPTLTGATTATASFTPTTPGRYTLTYTVTDDGGFTSSDTARVFVPGTTVTAIEVTSNVGAWTNVGGAADIPTALRDGSDTTYAASPTATGSSAPVRMRLAPMIVPATFTLNLRHMLSAAGSGTATVTLWEGATARKTWTATPGTTTAASTFTLTSGEIATVTSWNELDIELSWT